MASKTPAKPHRRAVGDFVRMRYGNRIRLGQIVGPEHRYASGQRIMRVRLLSRVPPMDPVEFNVPIEWLEDATQREQREAKSLLREVGAPADTSAI